MDLQLQNKVSLVTGSTAGIGFAIAEALASEGASVIINGRSQQSVDEAIGKLSQKATGKLTGCLHCQPAGLRHHRRGAESRRRRDQERILKPFIIH
jgi:NAD(P)-dependent dehydrogenase (short-subunit alcohol dehydrogenase family)